MSVGPPPPKTERWLRSILQLRTNQNRYIEIYFKQPAYTVENLVEKYFPKYYIYNIISNVACLCILYTTPITHIDYAPDVFPQKVTDLSLVRGISLVFIAIADQKYFRSSRILEQPRSSAKRSNNNYWHVLTYTDNIIYICSHIM